MIFKTRPIKIIIYARCLTFTRFITLFCELIETISPESHNEASQ
jgi:hypothetical protein